MSISTYCIILVILQQVVKGMKENKFRPSDKDSALATNAHQHADSEVQLFGHTRYRSDEYQIKKIPKTKVTDAVSIDFQNISGYKIYLQVLDISRNKINILVPEVGNLEQLRHLNAQQTNIATLPPEIAFCQELEELLLWGNAIESLPETMREMPRLQSMTINYRSFCTMVDNYMDNLLKKGQIQSEHIPLVIFEMQGLTELDLGDTKINTLPEKCLGHLTELYIHKNYFLKLPEMVLNLYSLQILDISENIMLNLPEEIIKLRNLRVLRAGDNKFREITSSIGVLTQLEELSLCGNELETLPESIGKLTKLKTLLLDRNKLKAIPGK